MTHVTTSLCLLALLIAGAAAQSVAPATGPLAFAPTQASTASSPNPTATNRQRTGNYASDSLATTPTSYNQIQTIGTYSSAHVAPPVAIQDYLNTSTAQDALPADLYVPQSTQYDHPQLFNQLENMGARQFHFPIYYDPIGNLYQQNAGLKIANMSGNLSTTDLKWTYPGWKVMNEPNFDFNTTCTTLTTCVYNIKNWIVSTPDPVPITIFLEPRSTTYTSETGENTTFAEALAASNQTGGPDTLAQPLNIGTVEPLFQPWRDLENELLDAFTNSTYALVTPEDLMDGEADLKTAVFKDGYTLYPALQYLKGRIFFVLSGEYVNNYLEFHPDLVNATLFVSEPYNDDGNYTSSTLFVDVLGALEGATPTNFSESDARSAAKAQSQRINKAARAGYMVRASTDWATVEPRNNFTGRATELLSSGAHFLQTTFPTTPTLFPSTYTVALPVRGNAQQSTRCNPVTSGGVVFNATQLYTTGCPAVNALTPTLAPSTSSS